MNQARFDSLFKDAHIVNIERELDYYRIRFFRGYCKIGSEIVDSSDLKKSMIKIKTKFYRDLDYNHLKSYRGAFYTIRSNYG